MFLIFGLGTRVRQLGVATFVCRNCGSAAAQVVTRRSTRFTLFFIPLIPIRTRYAVQCTYCGAAHDVSRDEAGRLAAGAMAH